MNRIVAFEPEPTRQGWLNKLRAIASIVVGTVLIFAALSFVHLPKDNPGVSVLLTVTAVVACLVIYGVVVRFVEGRRSLSEFAPRRALLELLMGSAFAIVLYSAMVGVFIAQGWAKVESGDGWGGFFVGLALWTLPVITEELLFRGFLFGVINRHFGTWLALIISSIAFGLAHAGVTSNPWTLWGIAGGAGFFFTALYLVSGRLWLPIAFHLTWNLIESRFWGLEEPGSTHNSVFRTILGERPDVMTDTQNNPVTVGILFIAGVALVLVAARRGRFVSIFPSRRPTAFVSAP